VHGTSEKKPGKLITEERQLISLRNEVNYIAVTHTVVKQNNQANQSVVLKQYLK
jgi:hypothetical protein